MNAVELTKKAGELVGGDRAKQHGDKYHTFSNIARLWNAYLTTSRFDVPCKLIEVADVGIMLALMKIARMQGGELNPDDYIDAIGYIACAGEIASG